MKCGGHGRWCEWGGLEETRRGGSLTDGSFRVPPRGHCKPCTESTEISTVEHGFSRSSRGGGKRLFKLGRTWIPSSGRASARALNSDVPYDRFAAACPVMTCPPDAGVVPQSQPRVVSCLIVGNPSSEVGGAAKRGQVERKNQDCDVSEANGTNSLVHSPSALQRRMGRRMLSLLSPNSTQRTGGGSNTGLDERERQVSRNPCPSVNSTTPMSRSHWNARDVSWMPPTSLLLSPISLTPGRLQCESKMMMMMIHQLT